MKRNAYISAAACVVLMVGGPAAAMGAASADTARTVPAAAAAVRGDVTAEGAAAAALKHYPGVVQSLDKDGSTWDVDVISKDGKGHAELDVNEKTGAVTERDRDTDEDSAEHQALLAAKVTAEQAIKAALAAHPGRVSSVDWDEGDAVPCAPPGVSTTWNVEVEAADGKNWNVHVDPTTAKVTAADSNDENRNN